MGLIKEPLDVDFYVDPRPLTKNEEIAISKFIKAHKSKMKTLKGIKTKKAKKVKA